MSEKEKKKEIIFNLDDFYRKLGIWLLFLLLIVIITLGVVILITQREILENTKVNYVYKSEVKVIDSKDL